MLGDNMGTRYLNHYLHSMFLFKIPLDSRTRHHVAISITEEYHV